MIAAIDEKVAARVGELAFFDILHPCSVHAYRYVMFGFARYCACMTTNALTLVYYEGIFCQVGFLLTG